MTTAVLLIASGHSVRLGRDKPTLRLCGESLVQRHLRQARSAGAERAIVVVNDANRTAIASDVTGAGPGAVEICLRRRGPDAQDALRDGMDLLGDTDVLFVGGITDVVPDGTHQRLAAHAAAIAVPTARLAEPFVGGLLMLSGDRIRRIVEKPAGGCPPGSMVNAWIHRIAGAGLVRTVVEDTRRLGHYQKAINGLIQRGVIATALAVSPWRSIKTAADVEAARRMFDPAGAR